MKINRKKIENLLREKIQYGKSSDQELADILNVHPSTVSRWRNRFGIPPADKFEKRFRKKYGKNSIEIFKQMIEEEDSLQKIANRFGFTREYARQVYNKLYSDSDKLVRPRRRGRYKSKLRSNRSLFIR